MAAGSIIKYVFFMTVVLFGTKTLILVKKTNENLRKFQAVNFDTENSRRFPNQSILQNSSFFNGRNYDHHETAPKDRSTGKVKGNSPHLKNNSKEKANKTREPDAVNNLQRKRKLLSQLWDKYYKMRSSTTNNLIDTLKFYQVDEDIFVFSAFYDNRLTENQQNPVVRILAISKLSTKSTVACRFSNTAVSKWEMAGKIEMSDSHSKLYGGVMYICNTPHEFQQKPPKTVYLQSFLTGRGNFSKVTSKLVTKEKNPLEMTIRALSINHHTNNVKKSSSKNLKKYNARHIFEIFPNDREFKEVHIVNQSKKIPPEYKERQLNSTVIPHKEELLRGDNTMPRISVCVSPLFGDVKLSQFIQFVEIHKILGVDHMFFYKMNISSDIERMLKYYGAQGKVTSIDWSLPSILKDPSTIWYNGQIAAMQDCLYRNIGNFHYTAFVDIDEVIIPNSYKDWPEMLENFEEIFKDDKNSIPSVFSFKSAFFEQDAKTEERGKTKSPNLSFLRSIYRNQMISSKRSKVIIKPALVELIGIHHVSKLLNSEQKLKRVHVSPENALIHHYRKCTTALDTEMHCGKYIADTSLSKYSDSLVQNYNNALEDNIHYFRAIK